MREGKGCRRHKFSHFTQSGKMMTPVDCDKICVCTVCLFIFTYIYINVQSHH